MVRRTLRFLKPLGIALLILAAVPCVVSSLCVVWCRRELTVDRESNRVALARSWHTFHELEPLQKTEIPPYRTPSPSNCEQTVWVCVAAEIADRSRRESSASCAL